MATVYFVGWSWGRTEEVVYIAGRSATYKGPSKCTSTLRIMRARLLTEKGVIINI